MSEAAVVLDGRSLHLDDVVAVARRGAPVRLDPDALDAMRRARAVVERVLARGDAVYGLNTGVGVRKRLRLDGDEIDRFNHRLIGDHRMAQGPDASPDVVRATMLRLANGLLRGSSGVRPLLAERLAEALNGDEHPQVRMLGSTGTSDLAQMADLAAGVFAGVTLAAKEGIALLNNGAFTTAVAALALADCARLLETLTAAAALDLEAFAANPTPLHPAVAESRPYPGLVEQLARLRAELAGSALLDGEGVRNLQDPLSFRGVAAILGALRDALAFALAQLDVELNAAQGNPLVIAEEARIVSVANYEVLPLATALDLARIALAPALSSANERLVKLLQAPLSGLTDGLAAFGSERESALSEYTWPAQALAIEARLLAQPVSVEIGSSTQAEGIEDRVTMAPLAARRLAEMVRLADNLVAIELVVAAQAVELRHGAEPRALGTGARRTFEVVRRVVPFTGPGGQLAPDLEPLCALLRAGALAAPATSQVGA